MKKKYRLKRNHDIASVVFSKNRISKYNFNVYFVHTEEENSKFAISVSKKIGGAVVRNYYKRIIREITRPFLDKIKYKKVVIVIKQKCLSSNYSELKGELTKILIDLNSKRRVYEKNKL